MAKGTGWLERYQLARARVIELKEEGLPEFWVKLADPATKEHGWLAKLGTTRRVDPDKMSEEDVRRMFDDQKRILAELILDWNLTHPVTGEPLPIPKKSRDSLDLLPLEFIMRLNEEMGKMFEQMGPPRPSGS